MDNKITALERQIEQEQKRLKKIQRAKSQLRKLEDVTDEEKAACFDELFKLFEKQITSLLEDGYAIKDIRYWAYETAAMGTFGQAYFDLANLID